MSYYNYQPEQPRNPGNLYPGWSSNMQYPQTYSQPMERDWSNSTGTSNQATWSESGERNYALSSPVTPTSAANSPGGYYPDDTTQATPTTSSGNPEGDWSLYYRFVVPTDKRKESYWELQDCYKPTDAMPKRRPIEKQKKTGQEVYPCLEPGCTTPKPFKRTADLQRHYTQLHAPPDPSSQYHCDYSKCSRAQDPLGRKDHYRDHLRDFHGEDLVKRSKDKEKSSKKSKSSSSKSGKSEKGESSPPRVNVSEKWWRCTKCLERKYVTNGWFCEVCKKPCEEERIQNRMNKSRQLASRHAIEDVVEEEEEDEYIKSESSPSPTFSTTSTVYQTPGCSSEQAGSGGTLQGFSDTAGDEGCVHRCNNTWVYNGFTASWDPCPNCQGSSKTPILDTSASTDYQVSYSGASNTNTVATTTTYPAVSASTWQQQQQQPMESIAEYDDCNIPLENSVSPTVAEVVAPIPQYKTNCGHCSNYMVWDGENWIPCLACQAPVQVPSQRAHHRSRHEKQTEKDKKRSRRSSGWF